MKQCTCRYFAMGSSLEIFTGLPYYQTMWWVPVNPIVKSYNQTVLEVNLYEVKCLAHLLLETNLRLLG